MLLPPCFCSGYVFNVPPEASFTFRLNPISLPAPVCRSADRVINSYYLHHARRAFVSMLLVHIPWARRYGNVISLTMHVVLVLGD